MATDIAVVFANFVLFTTGLVLYWRVRSMVKVLDEASCEALVAVHLEPGAEHIVPLDLTSPHAFAMREQANWN